MKQARRLLSSARSGELAGLRFRLAEAEQTLRAIYRGDVDAVVVASKHGRRVFTLQGAEHAYRVLIESMNEGALTMTAGAVIIYANRHFGEMVKRPLNKVMGSSFLDFLATDGRAAIRPLLKQTDRSGSRIQLRLKAGDGSHLPVKLSLRRLAKNGFRHAPIGMVVTNMAETQRIEELLRALTHRVVQAQENERGRVALELHDRLTQLHCAIILHSQALAAKLSARDKPLRKQARQLRKMAGKAAKELARISRNLRPSVLDELGLVDILPATTAEFTDWTGVPVKLVCEALTERLPADTELVLYRILQEALENVRKHARANHVTVQLAKQDHVVLLTIKDDGIGFNPVPGSAKRQRKGDLGLLGMRERAISMGGALTVKSVPRAGTKIEVRIPVPPRAAKPP